MTDARDELAALIRTSLNADSRLVDRGYVGENDIYDAADAADAIIAAGWTSPRDERMEQILDAMGAWDDE